MYRTFNDYDAARTYAIAMARQMKRDISIVLIRSADGSKYFAVSSIPDPKHCFGSDARKERFCASEYRL